MKKKMFTLSYDDNVLQDKRLVELLNKYGLKCTFNVNSGIFSDRTHIHTSCGVTFEHFHIEPEEVKDLYDGHEVATHSVTHPSLVGLDEDRFTKEVVGDMEALSALVGYKVNGHAYPGGCFDEETARRLGEKGIRYARTVVSTGTFDFPENPLIWNPTAAHVDGSDGLRVNKKLFELADKFIEAESGLFYVWGHAYELDPYDNWEVIEEFFKKISGHDDIMYLTNSQVLDELGL
ncbi:MAG: polysaccharide deacetylase family protein [Clostridia bacterium]|nr:polysaccharide deacetylase family protein [Clostridia bacterium]